MPEKTLPNPLSGREIVIAINDHISRRLHSDCYLNPDLAYPRFKAKIKIELVLADDVNGEKPIQVEATVEGGESVIEDQFLNVSETEFEIDANDSPNTLREETGQPVPVRGEDGKTHEVKYARRSKGR